VSNRAKIGRMIELACKHNGFCGGPRSAKDMISPMKRIDAKTFALAILQAEGFGEAAEHETEWFPYFVRMFRDVFGDIEITLEDH
jgi:hypothetical protein